MAVSLAAPRALARLAAPLRALVAAVLERERRRAGEIGLKLADDAELRAVNRAWRGIDRATDVISFAYDEREREPAKRPVTGDLVISLDRVRVQARRYRVTPGAELARLVIHGMLHLCGHGHAAAGERRLMRARERAIARSAGAVIRALDARLGAAPERPAARPRVRAARGARGRAATAVALLALGLGALAAMPASATCPPPGPVLAAIRDAESVRMVRLGPRGTRVDDRFGDDPGHWFGFERLEVVDLPARPAAALVAALGGGSGYDCGAAAPSGAAPATGPMQIGFAFASPRRSARALVSWPEGRVAVECENGARYEAWLSAHGRADWARFVREISRAHGRDERTFYQDMSPPPGPGPSSGASRAEPAGRAR